MVKSSSGCPGNPFKAFFHILASSISSTLTARHHQVISQVFHVIVNDVNFDVSACKVLLQVAANHLLQRWISFDACIENGIETELKRKEKEE